MCERWGVSGPQSQNCHLGDDVNPGEIKILLVEDNPGDVFLMHLAVREAEMGPIKLERVQRLSEGMDRLRGSAFDVILLDLSLPDSQGIDTLAHALEHASDIPIIVFTTIDDEELAIKAAQMGAQDYLVKGQVDEKLLLRSIRYAIERHAQKRAA